MKKYLKGALLSAALTTGSVQADETKVPAQVVETGTKVPAQVSETGTKVDLIVRNNSLGLGVDLGGAYVEVTGDVKTGDEYGVGGAYGLNNGLIFGGSFAKKANVGTQSGVGAGYVKNFDKAYLAAAGKYTKFDADNAYADSDSYKAQVLAGVELAPHLYAEAGAGLKTFKAEGYDRETSAEGTLGVNFVQPDYSIKVVGTVNEVGEQITAFIKFPIGGKNSTSSLSVGQDTVEKYIADSSFDDEIVKKKKTPTPPETPNQAPTIDFDLSGDVVPMGDYYRAPTNGITNFDASGSVDSDGNVARIVVTDTKTTTTTTTTTTNQVIYDGPDLDYEYSTSGVDYGSEHTYTIEVYDDDGRASGTPETITIDYNI